MRKIALFFLLALMAATGHAECVRFAVDGTSGPCPTQARREPAAAPEQASAGPCELGVKLAHDAYLLATPDAMWPSATRLHYAVDYLGDMEVARHDRQVAHRAVAYLARETQKGGMLDIRKAVHTLQGLVEIQGA